jgi:hypothetical protein
MIDSVNGIIGAAQAMHQAKINQQLEISAVKLANDTLKQQGQAEMQLIEAVPAPSPTEGSGQNINVMV